MKEGIYLPDIHLLPSDENGVDVAKRLVKEYRNVMNAYRETLRSQGTTTNTALVIASIIQREAAGREDMALVSGVIWNRLKRNMKLEVDSTVQYARGKTEKGWWTPIVPEDKNIDSPYNTYLYKGLPPHPISNPGIEAIDAAVFPETTDCLYFIHDYSGRIHCAETFAEHRQNIKKYL